MPSAMAAIARRNGWPEAGFEHPRHGFQIQHSQPVAQPVYNVLSRPRTDQQNKMPEPETIHAATKPRRGTVIASGLLCGVLALVVIYTKRSAFYSLRAVVVVAAIGFAAVLLQLWLRNREKTPVVHPPIWLNALGILFALAALFADSLKLSEQASQVMALGAVGSFAVSGALILDIFRRDRIAPK